MTSLPVREQNLTCVSVTARSHAGEILQGAIRRQDRTRRVLVSLPATSLMTTAEVVPTPGRALAVVPGTAHKTTAAVHHLLAQLAVPPPEVRVRLTSNIPQGKGCGSSTTDIFSAVQAVLRYLGISLPEDAIARLIVAVEQAADSTILSRLALFRHREGVVEEYLPSPLPDLRVVVIDTQPGTVVSTTSLERARYSHRQINVFEDLIQELREGLRRRCARTIGAVATKSALLNEQFLPKPHFRTLLSRVLDWGGYGVAAAHSGTVVSALLPSGVDPLASRELGAALKQLQLRVVTRYGLGDSAFRFQPSASRRAQSWDSAGTRLTADC